MKDFEDFEEFEKAETAEHYVAANRLLIKWLSDDDDRAALYAHLRKHRPVLGFQSCADTKARPTDDSDSVYHQVAYLLTARADVVRAMADGDNFSNSPYKALGSGTFMLGLDKDDPDHERQRNFAWAYLRHVGIPPGTGHRGDEKTDQDFEDYLRNSGRDARRQEADENFKAYLDHVDTRTILALSTVAFMAGAALPLKQRKFDLVDLAEQVALRYVAFLFGFAQSDHPIIEGSMRKAYMGLNYQILGRHFVSEPAIMPNAIGGMAVLLERVAYLIDLYRARVGRGQEDEFKVIDTELRELRDFKDQNGLQPLLNFTPIMRRIAENVEPGATGKYSGTEIAVIVVGLVAGTIGNVQASVSIAINHFLKSRCHEAWKRPHDESRKAWVASHDAAADPELQKLIWEALRLQPPVAFLPRTARNNFDLGPEGKTIKIKAGANLILAIGAATNEPGKNEVGDYVGRLDPLIFGGPPGRDGYLHQCLGQHLAMPLITHIIRQVLLLPGLAQTLDPVTGDPIRLQKLWGFNCQTYPLEFKRFGILKQSPLNVIMTVKMPLSEHAEKLKLVVKYGAPRIEKKLRDSGHVHFAQFLFLENDTKLGLFTWYDRDFDSYIEHFALDVGPLFDKIFEHIQDAPPLPVDKFPKEFVDTIRRFNVRPAADYFFSAYPNAEASTMVHDYTRKCT